MSTITRGVVAAITAAILAAGGLWVFVVRPSGPQPSHHRVLDGHDGAAAGTGSPSGTPPVAGARGHGEPSSAVGPGGETGGSVNETGVLPAVGLYVGPGDEGEAEAVDKMLGGKVAYVLDFLPRTTWTAIDDVTWLLADWKGTPFRVILAVPMLPGTGATLAEGATGGYDRYFSELARHLVAGGMAGSTLMVGWQPDDQGTPWYVGNAAAARAYVTYWDDIRSVMSAVPGARFDFEWDVGDSGSSPVSPAAMYPGNAAVDVVATDAFDIAPAWVPPGRRWKWLLGAPGGPAWIARFASNHHKPMAVAMWGEGPVSAHGNGDDGEFVTQLWSWARREGAVMCVLWDQATTPWALTGGGLPRAKSAFLQAVSPGTQ